MDEADSRVTSRELAVRLSWTAAEDLTIQASDQMLVQFVQDYFLLSIGQTAHPAVSSDDDPRMKQLTDDPTVLVRPLVRLALTRRSMERFVDAMTTVLNASRLEEQAND